MNNDLLLPKISRAVPFPNKKKSVDLNSRDPVFRRTPTNPRGRLCEADPRGLARGLKESGRRRWLATNCQENSGEQAVDKCNCHLISQRQHARGTDERPDDERFYWSNRPSGLGSNRAADTLRGWILHSTLADAMANRADVHAGQPFRPPIDRSPMPRSVHVHPPASKQTTWDRFSSFHLAPAGPGQDSSLFTLSPFPPDDRV